MIEIHTLKQQLQQLQALHDGGALSAGPYEEGKRALERQLVDMVLAGPQPAAAPVSSGSPSARPSRRLLAVLGIGVLMFAAVGYAWIGAPAEAAADRAALPPVVAAMFDPALGGATTGASVSGSVALAAALADKAQPEDTVFVFARAVDGPRIPLAALRRQVKDLPFDFRLDESMAMSPEATLSSTTRVVITARVSRSGDAIAAAGDLSGVSAPVDVGSSGVKIDIDSVVTK